MGFVHRLHPPYRAFPRRHPLRIHAVELWSEVSPPIAPPMITRCRHAWRINGNSPTAIRPVSDRAHPPKMLLKIANQERRPGEASQTQRRDARPWKRWNGSSRGGLTNGTNETSGEIENVVGSPHRQRSSKWRTRRCRSPRPRKTGSAFVDIRQRNLHRELDTKKVRQQSHLP